MRVNPEVLMKRATFLLLLIVLVLAVFAAKFRHLTDANAVDYAQLARNVAEGKGYTTSVLSPLAFSLVRNPDTFPELARAPVHPTLLAAAIRLGGATDRTVALASLFCFVLVLLLAYFICLRYFTGRVAIYSCLMLVASVPLLQASMSGLDTLLVAFWVLCLFGLMCWWERSEGKQALLWPIATGVVLALCYLTRYEMLPLLPCVFYYWWRVDRQRLGRRCLLTLVVFVVLVAPWVIRSSVIVKGPFISTASYELIMLTPTYPGQRLYQAFRDVPPKPWLVAAQHPREMLAKVNRGLTGFYVGFVGLVGLCTLPFFLIGLLRRDTPQQTALPWSMFIAILLVAGVLALYTPDPQMLLAFAPVIIILGTHWFTTLVAERFAGPAPTDHQGTLAKLLSRRLRRWGPESTNRLFVQAWLVGWFLLAAYPMLNYLFVADPAPEHPVVPTCKALAGEEPELIATDIPWMVAWYGNKRVVHLPNGFDELTAMGQAGLRVDGLYFSPNVRVQEATLAGFERSASWIDRWPKDPDTGQSRAPGMVWLLTSQ